MSTLTPISQFLTQTPYCFIATSENNTPHVRAFQFQFELEGKLWFCTAKSKDIYKQFVSNPQVEICAVKEDMSWIRITGQVTLDDNAQVKERILNEQPLIKGIYGTADNPDFTTFYIQHGHYILDDFSGTPATKGTF